MPHWTEFAGAELARSAQLRRLSRFLVLETLGGRHDTLKEYTIGVEVFERGADFDPRVDPIVRVQTSKLRRRLASYSERERATESIRFEIEPGGYVPRISRTPTKPQVETALTPLSGATVAVMPLLNVTGEPQHDYLCSGLSDELINLFGQIPGLRVIARTSSFAVAARNLDVRESAPPSTPHSSSKAVCEPFKASCGSRSASSTPAAHCSFGAASFAAACASSPTSKIGSAGGWASPSPAGRDEVRKLFGTTDPRVST